MTTKKAEPKKAEPKKAEPKKATDTAGTADSDATGELPQHSFFTRLYTGTGAFEVIGKRTMWFGISGGIVAVAILSILIQGFTFGIDFAGGTKVSFPRGETNVAAVEDVYRNTIGADPVSVVVVGNGPTATVQIRSETLDNDQTARLRDALFTAFSPVGSDGQASPQVISDSAVSETWGDQITQKALIALVVFLVLVSIYITIRYERYMALSALAALGFDLITTAGIYSLVGFEVTPATVIGLLTIMGFSLYDTVIVFDKVEENTHGFQHTTRRTFAEQANLAINQTFMRSINTSLISVLPVLALIVVAVWLLGVGTLQDLALVQFVGILVGTYSSIFFATPLLVTLRERTELVKVHTRRVLNRRKQSSAAAKAEIEDTEPEDSDAEPVAVGATAAKTAGTKTVPAKTTASKTVPAKPAPGVRPSRPTATRTGRPSGKRNTR
ncbi:MAG: protein translocase subunit SecF [Mycobacterium sp.]